jgi:hypothetical protein
VGEVVGEGVVDGAGVGVAVGVGVGVGVIEGDGVGVALEVVAEGDGEAEWVGAAEDEVPWAGPTRLGGWTV